MNIQKITFANGCFWCTAAIFKTLKGVESVTSGYMGGHTNNPAYMEISTGNTGHAEVVMLEYDADCITLDDLLLVFFRTHNPTVLNLMGNGAGTRYLSAIYFHNDEQKQHAETMIKKITVNQVFDKPILTIVAPAVAFYRAEDRHQNYFSDNPDKPFCAFVIQPKLNKFAKEFAGKIKPELLFN